MTANFFFASCLCMLQYLNYTTIKTKIFYLEAVPYVTQKLYRIQDTSAKLESTDNGNLY